MTETSDILVELWQWRLNLYEGPDVLSPDEVARASRFARAEDALAFRAARSGLRHILAEYAGGSPADLVFDYSAEGKPFLAAGPAFNLSHSGGLSALAVAVGRQVRVGLDIEAHRHVGRDVAERFFSTAERAALASLSGDAWREGFFRCWTRKEAFVKALGLGLRCPLDSFDVTLGPEARLTRVAEGGADRWTLVDLLLGTGFAGALAVETEGRDLRLVLRRGSLPLPTQ